MFDLSSENIKPESFEFDFKGSELTHKVLSWISSDLLNKRL